MTGGFLRTGAAGGAVVLLLAAGLTLGARTGVAQEASVYKWVDQDGIPHYTDQPPVGATVEELPIRYRKTDGSKIQAKAKATAELTAAAGIREEQEAADAANAATERDSLLAERQAGCEQARSRMAKYEQARRIYRPGPDGERIYLSDEELDAERANARRAVGEWCGEE